MFFTETELKGAFVIEIEKRQDERGLFARVFCEKEFETHGLSFHPVQANTAYSKKRGTLRGMHYQVSPYEEAKLIRCVKGMIYDVIIDLRPESSTYKQWFGVELTSDNYKMLYVPKGFAHGYQILEDDSEIFYQVSQFYHPEAERGLRYNDPVFGIKWPIEVKVISDKDKSWPNYLL